MTPVLRNGDAVIIDPINQPIALIDPARPVAGQLMPQHLGLADAGKRRALNVSDQLVDPRHSASAECKG